ncbi:hypothetical protein E1301_Tti016596 [Triplophysa tibetana]|uniref:C-type lectin domain-containing protein n=1 Tax=Triplophysa tibetana TaxID=1572043 RepID=A0A5A9MZL7_9TELE|nr:hypothetical protein E1301_Tti016596 [Triplophysa tibetana]
MFLILLIASMFSQGLATVSYGKDFITAFPENTGYFYPYTSSRSLRITALHNDTTFNVHFNNTQTPSSVLQSGQTVSVSFPITAEVHRLGSSSNSIRITSEKDIVVHSFSQTDATTAYNSVQSHVVQPITKLGTSYLIPSLNQSDLVQTFSGSLAPLCSQRYSSFKLIIINAEDTENTLTIFKSISGSVQEEKIKISSYQLLQMQADASLIKVESSHKVAVILTHPCLENTTSCKCNMIVNQILPAQFQGQNFVVPYIPGITQSRLLMTSNDMSASLSHNNVQLQPSPSGFLSLSDQMKSQYVKASGYVSLTLISPGLIFEVIPENMFAACYLLQFYSDTSSTKKALVIAETGSKNNVHKQNIPVTNTQWTEIIGTKYSSAEISFSEFTTVIWHPTSKIAVYLLENSGTSVYGGPAIPINTQPDEFGCVAIPGHYEVGNDRLSWAESLAHCTSLQKHLACPTSEDIQKELSGKVNGTEEEEAWIGLRRSLMTTDWYWQRQTPSTTSLPSSSVDYFYWADGHPDEKFRGLCASLLLNQDDEYKWKSAKCCEKKRPVCYKPSISFYPLTSDTTSSASLEFF